MVWAILFMLGIPLWFIVIGIGVTVMRNRKLRERHGNISARVLRPGKTRWTRGNAIWVSDVFVFRGSPAAWSEEIVHVTAVTTRDPSAEEAHKLRKLGDGMQIATLTSAEGERYEVATTSEHRAAPGWSLHQQGDPGRAARSSRHDQNTHTNTIGVEASDEAQDRTGPHPTGARDGLARPALLRDGCLRRRREDAASARLHGGHVPGDP